jgi:hypothetical protein
MSRLTRDETARAPRGAASAARAESAGASKSQHRRGFPATAFCGSEKVTHIFLTARVPRFTLKIPVFPQLKGGDPMSNGLMTPFAIASVSIATEDRKARSARSDTPVDLSA